MDLAQSIFPVISCSDLDTARDFYRELLGLDVVFESGWYTLLRSRDRFQGPTWLRASRSPHGPSRARANGRRRPGLP